MPSDLSNVGGPNPDAADGQLALAALRRAMFDRDTPVHIDRYRLLRKLGQGAQGTVYEAEDTELGRRLAVKILAAGTGSDAPDQARRLREARAMASVSHPHVVQIYAAGRSNGQVWIAMELVRGTTLAQWLTDRDMDDAATRIEARRILRCAGEGLAAANALGFVHRDFKPANVLLGEGDAIKLTDFGLARPFDWLGSPPPGDTTRHLETPPDATHDTTWAGTPRYMSPEQLRGQPAGAASDQFNFAVTTWEVLFGTHPFAHESLDSLQKAIAAQVLSRPTVRSPSRSLIRALRKALQPKPDDRHLSLHPLLRALAPLDRRRGRVAMFVGAGACVTTAALWPAAEDPGPQCSLSEAHARFEAAAGDAKPDVVAAAVLRTTIPDAQNVATRVGQELDDYAQRWAARQHEVCEAGWGALHTDQRRFDNRSACLQQQLATLAALTTQLADADAALASRSVTAVRGLPDPQRCLTDGVTWESQTPVSRALRARVAVAAADALAGRYRKAAVAAQQIEVEATRESLPGVKVAALEVAAEAYAELSDARRFVALSDAYYAAAELNDLASMARVGGELARQYAYDDQLDEARRWLRHGDAALRPETELETRLVFEHAEGLIAFRDDDAERGESLLLGILDTLEGEPAQTSETGWLVSMWLAMYYSWRGRPEDGDALCEELREGISRELGSAHPRLSRIAAAQAVAAGERGDRNGALGFGYEAVELAERGYGPVNERTAFGHTWLARVLQSRGRFDQAEARFRAAALAAGDEPSKVKVRLLYAWASMRTAQDQPTDALAMLRQSERIAETLFEPDSGELRRLREQLADARAAVADAP